MALKATSSRMSRSIAILVLVSLFGCAAYIINHQPTAHAVGSSFSFGAVGDNGDDNGTSDQTNASSNTLKAAGGKNISFVQTLGDLAYDPSSSVTTANGWCQWATDNMKSTNSGVDIPLLLSAGNHEAQDYAPGFTIEDYTSAPACANPLAAQTTYYGGSNSNYAKDFYFDYPAVSPSVRVININPGLTYQAGGVHDYSKNGTLYNWVSSAIDAAKVNSQWVVVTYHVPYINAGSAHGGDMNGTIYGPYAQQFTDLFNLFVNKKVDLILNGHEHNYQRTKQFTLGASCTAIAHDSYNTNCVLSHTGTSGDPYTKGSGPVELIIGTGGHKPSNVNTGDSDYPYMLKAASGSGDCGLVQFDVTSTTLTGTFINACGGSLSDTFTIAAAADTTAPTVSLTAPANGATVSGSSVSLTATATDNIGVTKVEFYQGLNKVGESTSSPYAVTWNTTSATNGSYQLTAKAYDAAGNTTTSTVVTVTVSNTGPVVPPKTSFSVPNKDGSTTTINLTGSCSAISSSGAVSTLPSSIDSSKLLTSLGFTSTCPSAGGSTNVTVDLGKKYPIATLQILKTQSDGTLKDITSSVTITDQTVSGAVHTIITFSVTDGTANDSDGTSDSKIVDPVFVLGSSQSGATTTSLANTGFDSILPVLAGVFIAIISAGSLIRPRA